MIFAILSLLLQAGMTNSTTNVTALGSTVAGLSNPSNITNGLLIFIAETITVILEILMILAISMQLARGYFLRVLRKFTLRLAADLWWLIFILLRDITVLLVLLLGMILFLPFLDLQFPVSVPLQPLAIVLYAFALVILLVKDTDESQKWDGIVTTLVATGTGMYMLGTILVTESAVQLAHLPSTVSLSSSNPWGFAYHYLNSVQNPALTIYTFYITFTLLAVAGIIAVAWSFKVGGGMPKAEVRTIPKPSIKTAPSPTLPQPQMTAPAIIPIKPPAPSPAPSPAPAPQPHQPAPSPKPTAPAHPRAPHAPAQHPAPQPAPAPSPSSGA